MLLFRRITGLRYNQWLVGLIIFASQFLKHFLWSRFSAHLENELCRLRRPCSSTALALPSQVWPCCDNILIIHAASSSSSSVCVCVCVCVWVTASNTGMCVFCGLVHACISDRNTFHSLTVSWQHRIKVLRFHLWIKFPTDVAAKSNWFNQSKKEWLRAELVLDFKNCVSTGSAPQRDEAALLNPTGDL